MVLEILSRRAQHDFVDIDIAWLLDGEGDRAGDRIRRNSDLVEIADDLGASVAKFPGKTAFKAFQ